jgi:hypothetical protein
MQIKKDENITFAGVSLSIVIVALGTLFITAILEVVVARSA